MLLILLTSLLGWFPTEPPVKQKTVQTEKVILIQLDVQFPTQVEECYSNTYDKKKVELNVEFDDTINYLQDFIFEEDPIEGPGCFIPQMKIIYKDYTYVFSLYCTSVQRYKNLSPFVPSSKKMPNDIEITETVHAYLKAIHRKYFGFYPNPQAAVCSRFIRPQPVVQEKDSELGFDEEDESDIFDMEIEKDLLNSGDLFDMPHPEDEIKAIEPDDEG